MSDAEPKKLSVQEIIAQQHKEKVDAAKKAKEQVEANKQKEIETYSPYVGKKFLPKIAEKRRRVFEVKEVIPDFPFGSKGRLTAFVVISRGDFPASGLVPVSEFFQKYDPLVE